MTEHRKTVLVVAYACEPNEPSEPGVGWNFTREISKSFRTIVLTRANNRRLIEKDHTHDAIFIYYDLPPFFMKLKKRTPLSVQWYYALWRWGAYNYAKRYISQAENQIDLVHHLNFSTMWFSPPAYLLKQPFVWGPIGGGDYIPFRFFDEMNFRSKVEESIYYLITQLSKYSISSFLARKKADALLFRTESTKNNFPKTPNKIVRSMSETASHLLESNPKKHSVYVRAICVGRLIYLKGYMYILKAFHSFIENGGKGALEIFGEGPEKNKIEGYIQKHNLTGKIILRGFVSNEEIKKKMNESTVLIHTSFREGGSWSIMEAMSFGLPVICLNNSGPKDMVTENCGILIDLKTPGQLIKDITQALFKLVEDNQGYEEMSRNAIERIQKEYNWKKRGEQIVEVYNDTLRHAEKRYE